MRDLATRSPLTAAPSHRPTIVAVDVDVYEPMMTTSEPTRSEHRAISLDNDDKYMLQDDLLASDAFPLRATSMSSSSSTPGLSSTWRRARSALMYLVLALAALYCFLVAIKLLEQGLTLALGCNTRSAFNFAKNPVAGLVVGTVATALIHSSSTVTSITVALVGTGSLTIRRAVPIVMGANIGTCVTCILVAFAQVGERRQFERAMAAATVHDMYNIWSVLVMFPIEVAFHPLEALARAMSNAKTEGGAFQSPLDAIVDPLTDSLVVVDKDKIYRVATGEALCERGGSFLMGGAFADTDLSDGAVGGLVTTIGVLILVAALFTLVRMMARVFLGTTKRVVARALDYNGYLNLVIGTALTFVVQSSTLVTSTLTPMAGLGVITLEQVYPLVIGANLGTTGTALLAALVTGKSDAVAIALAHFWFNVFGVLLFYPIPVTRKPIFLWANSLATWSAAWPVSAVIFVALCFVVTPAILISLVYMCTASVAAVQVVGWVLGAFVVVVLIIGWVWYAHRGGRERWQLFLERKRCERDGAEDI